MKEQIQGDRSFSERLPDMVTEAKIEIIPTDTILDRVDIIPRTSKLSVTASPTKGLDMTLDFTSALKEKGFTVIPHIAARSVRDLGHLRTISNFLDDNKIEEIFVIGGDNAQPVGEYSDSAQMLSDLLSINHSVREVGVGGYPEGHPLISHDFIISSLKSKVAIAREHGVNLHINSQACYDTAKVRGWLEELGGVGVNAPVYLGVPTQMDILKLAKISAEIGVGDSVAFLRLTGIGSALNSMLYDPKDLLFGLADFPESENIRGLHIFTFNYIKATMAWQRNFKTDVR